MWDDDRKHVELEGDVLAISAGAVRIEVDGYDAWVPRSLLVGEGEDMEVGDYPTFEIEQWKAKEIGWVE